LAFDCTRRHVFFGPLLAGAIPIAGAKTAMQAEQNAGALGWRLSDDEVALLDDYSERVSK